MVAVRPDLASQSLRAWSRACEVKPPAAAPHRMSQVGTSLSETVHSAGLLGVGVATGAAAGVATGTFSARRAGLYSAQRRRTPSVGAGEVTAQGEVPAAGANRPPAEGRGGAGC